jgi:tRNA(adenine34) deaminase
MKNLFHTKYMEYAIEMAENALKNGNFPVGAVIVADDEVVGKGFREYASGDEDNELDHAEIIALKDWIKNSRKGYGKYLTVYSTLEPCLMCLGALIINGINTIVYAVEDPMGGSCGSDFDAIKSNFTGQRREDNLYITNKPVIISGVNRQHSLKLFHEFYKSGNTYLRDTFLGYFLMDEGRKIWGEWTQF